ncbi:protein-export chaperone SecB [Salmonella enterica subsp. enterica]|nr:protein-export chaperone SecB [Salmonella enterica subsp. enterica]
MHFFRSAKRTACFPEDWQPEVKLDLDTASSQLADDVYEVVLRVTVTASAGRNRVHCAKFSRPVFSPSAVLKVLRWRIARARARNILFPYARECVPARFSRGTFRN